MNIYITTERLILREMLPADAEGMFILDSDPEVHRYLGGKPVKDIEETRKVISMVREQYISNGIGRWAVEEKSSGRFVGWSGLKLIKDHINQHTNFYDLGYRFIRDCWGLGYATETAIAGRDYAFNHMNIPELFGMADTENTGSRKVLEKTGLKYIETFVFDGAPHAWYRMENPTLNRLT
jgi:[ribosomal protein S5]-alanine N-acetyltransferase